MIEASVMKSVNQTVLAGTRLPWSNDYVGTQPISQSPIEYDIE